MESIIERIREEDAAAQADGWPRYIELLEKTDYTAKEVAEFKRLMLVLRRGADCVEEDRRTLAELKRLEGSLRDHSGLDEALQAAWKAHLDYTAAMEQKIQEMRAEKSRLLANQQSLFNKNHSARRFVIEVAELLEKHPQFRPLFPLPDLEQVQVVKFTGFSPRPAGGPPPPAAA